MPTAHERFRDRAHAGRLLAERLRGYTGLDGVVVLGLPRGGVPVAFEVARELDAPLDVFLMRKLGVPGQEELALIDALGLADETIEAIRVRRAHPLPTWHCRADGRTLAQHHACMTI